LRFPPVNPLIGGPEATIFAVSVRRDLVRLRVEFSSGRIIDKPAQIISSQQAKKTGLKPFRYLAMAMPGDMCIAEIVGFDSSGSEILDYETHLC
jgi:hypothetical protein